MSNLRKVMERSNPRKDILPVRSEAHVSVKMAYVSPTILIMARTAKGGDVPSPHGKRLKVLGTRRPMLLGFGLARHGVSSVPKGHLRMAQCFSIGDNDANIRVPKGRLNPTARNRPSLRDSGLTAVLPFNPTLKRWAILKHPCGMENEILVALNETSPPRYYQNCGRVLEPLSRLTLSHPGPVPFLYTSL